MVIFVWAIRLTLCFIHRMQVAVFAKYTGKSFEDMGEFLVRDSYMSPQEAMELNLIDGMIDVNEVKKAR